MRKLFYFLIPVLMFGCDRKPLYIIENVLVDIYVSVDVNINALWNSDWENELIYPWDDKIDYSIPDDSIIIIFFNGKKEICRVKSKVNTKTQVELKTSTNYDILIYNETQNIYEDDYHVVCKKSPDNIDSKIAQKYTSYLEPGEIFSTQLNNINISDISDNYSVQVVDGKSLNVWNINSEIKPISYIYLFQFIIEPDDGEDIECTSINKYTVSGIVPKKGLKSGDGYYMGLSQILCDDIKDGKVIDGNLVFASRTTILDIEGDNNSSWGNQENTNYFTAISLETKNFGTLNGAVNITNQITSKPNGGIITIRIKNSDLKKGQTQTEGFGITLSEWEEKIIDIPF